jgi:iron complex outermembrane receptor protein
MSQDSTFMRSLPAVVLALLLTLLAAAPVLAQETGTVTGRVTDSEDGTPVDAAQVSIVGSDRGGLSSAQGVYRVPEIPVGTYAVVVRRIGYADARVEGVEVVAGTSVTVDVALESRATALNPIVVTAQRREEKALESPSTIVTIGAERVQERAAVTPVEHVKALPGVDVSQTGLSQSNVVTRGFNNVFSGALLVITDNRYAHVPSLRFNAYNMIPATQQDVERMEVLLGPAAALYGPNSANGVLHIITESPMDEQETSISLTGGERSVFQGQFRTAFKTSESSALKVSANYFEGDDWRYIDPVEAAARAPLVSDPSVDPDTVRVGLRDFDTGKWGGEARFDWRPGDDTELILSTGTNTMLSSIELTGIGAAQADDWRYTYAQARFRKGRFFAQGFVNLSDAGDTYLLRTGQPIVDESRMWVGQLQHGASLGDRQDFIYGLDLQYTEPRTGGTITGRNEDADEITEIGGYLHSETALTDEIDLLAALRVDDHSELEDPVISPRAAISYSPTPDHSFRVTYNRAFDTPTTNNLFLDVVAQANPFGLGNDIRTLGVPSSGFTFDERCPGGLMDLCMRTPLAPQAGTLPAVASPDFWNPILAGLAAQDATFAQLEPLLRDPGSRPGDPALQSDLLRFNQERAEAGAFPFVGDQGPGAIGAIEPTIHNTFEIGYKGILGGRLLLTGDVYTSTINDFIGPLRTETPSVHYSLESVQAFVQTRLAPLIASGQVSAEQVQEIVGTLGAIPVGTVAPDQVDDADILLTYRNFGDVDLWGGDLAFEFLATDQLSFTGSYSYVSEDCFDFNEDPDDGCRSALDVALNAPQNKGSIGARWNDELLGLTAEARGRFVEGFPMNSGVFIGEVPGYGVVDVNVAYRLSAFPGARVSLTATNLLDNVHREFVGAPALGRLLLVRLGYTF